MSPEQASAYEDVDGRADLYSLGAVAYYLLTGNPPFSGANIVQLLVAHANARVVPPSKLNETVSGDLEQVVLRCLEKSPSDRYADAAALADALHQCQCASDWTAKEAAEWWAKSDRQAKKPVRPEQKPIDVTIDLNLGETTL